MNCLTILPISVASLAKLTLLGGVHQSYVRSWNHRVQAHPDSTASDNSPGSRVTSTPATMQPMSTIISPRTVVSTHLEPHGDRKTGPREPREITVDQAGVVFVQGRVYRHVYAVLQDKEDDILVVRGAAASSLRIPLLRYAQAVFRRR